MKGSIFSVLSKHWLSVEYFKSTEQQYVPTYLSIYLDLSFYPPEDVWIGQKEV